MSNFSQTCNLLSQYLKENGKFGDLTLGMTACSLQDTGTGTGTGMNTLPNMGRSTMNLFPQLAKDEIPNKTQSRVIEKSGQMTIFYGGKVLVFDNYPAEKAKELMLLASKAAKATGEDMEVELLQKPNSISSPSPSPPIVTPTTQRHQSQPIIADLPIARKASLARFLEKRKDRIIGRGPYGNKVVASPLGHGHGHGNGESKSWLGLSSAQSSVPHFNNRL